MNDKLSKYWDNIHLEYNSSYDNWVNKYVNMFNKTDNIIELGCGRAYCSRYLKKNGFSNVIACDFSAEVLNILKTEAPDLPTILFDMTDRFPFDDNSKNVIIADLCLHYFDLKTTKYILDEISRVLCKDGILLARVNSVKDYSCIKALKDDKKVEDNFYYNGKIYKRFFDKKDFETIFKNFTICNLEEKSMDRYNNPKILWEFCMKVKK